MDQEEIEIRINFKKQLELFENILKASSVEEVFTFREQSGLFTSAPSERVKEKSLEELKELAKESVETIKNILGEENGNN